jgi:hypothetical protein
MKGRQLSRIDNMSERSLANTTIPSPGREIYGGRKIPVTEAKKQNGKSLLKNFDKVSISEELSLPKLK